MTSLPDMTEMQIRRYARHIVLAEIGGMGQAKLMASRVLVVGAGGLGAPLLQYLAAAGVGTLGVIDDDKVDLSNLQRQVIHRTADIGALKVESAQRALSDINPEVRVVMHPRRLGHANVEQILAGYDIVADGSDNFATRYLVNDACYRFGKTLVSAAILRFDGQISTYKAFKGNGHPCLRCLFPQAPSEDAVPSCAQAGVLGALAGTLGALQATEVVKEILGIGRSLSGRLVMYDALAGTFDEMTIAKRPDCPTCGTA
ncbi:MAG TPA: molybdopterin-synthase adenylyltransferase MoeB [Reyranella sp.]|nr:molybdopterin-synthase adenylyltransferase MoeB [Reyranella sp.]